MPSVPDEVVLVQAAIVAGESRVALAAGPIGAALPAAGPVSAVFDANGDRTVSAGPTLIAGADVGLTNAVTGAVVRAGSDGELGFEAVEDVVGVGQEDDRHGARFSDQFRRQSSSAETSEQDGVVRRVAVVDEDVVVSALGVHLTEGQGDEVSLVCGQSDFRSVRLYQPLAMCILEQKIKRSIFAD